MTDAVAIETVDLRKSFGSTEALSGLTLSVPRGIDLRIPRQERIRQDDDAEGAAGHGAADERRRACVRPLGGRHGGERHDPRPRRIRERRQRPLRLHDRRRDARVHGVVLSALAPRPRGALPHGVRAVEGAVDQDAVARHAQQARADPGAVPRRGHADPRRAHVRARSGGHRAGAAGRRCATPRATA